VCNAVIMAADNMPPALLSVLATPDKDPFTKKAFRLSNLLRGTTTCRGGGCFRVGSGA